MLDFDLTAQEFRARYLERNFYHRPAAMQERPIAWSDLDELLHQIEPREPVFQLFREGLVPERDYTQEVSEFGRPRLRLLKQRFYEHLRHGATLVLNRLESHSLVAKRLCGEVARFAGQQAMSNAYLSFGGQGTFGKHWDTHDVFAVQLLGRKRWKLFAPTFPLPLSTQRSDHYPGPQPMTPVLDCVLAAGDLLYIPRGWWHQVLPLDEGSFHLSVGAYGPTVYDYLMWVGSRQLQRMPSARKGLLGNSESMADVTTALRMLSDVVSNPALLAEFMKDVASRERMTSEFDLGLFMAGNATLSGSTAVSLNSSQPLDLDRNELHFNGNRVPVDAVSRAVLRQLNSAGATHLAVLYDTVGASRDGVNAAVLGLVQQDVVSIAR